MAAPLKIYARGPNGVGTLEGNPGPTAERKTLHPGKSIAAPFTFNPSGDRYTFVDEQGVVVTDSNTDSALTRIPLPRVVAIAFSPKGSFLVIFQKPNAETKGEKNLQVFRTDSEGAPVLQLFQKGFTRDTWPSLHWSSDEEYLARLVNNEVHFYSSSDFSTGIVARLRCQGVAGLAVAPGHVEDPRFATFVPEVKGAPGMVKINSFSQLTNDSAPPLARRSFFKCSEVKLMWNSPGTAVLVLATTDVDKSNQSYYGESNLHFLAGDGSHEGGVPLGKEGPIHAVEWEPQGRFFVAVYGFMPATATIFSSTCRPVHQLGAKAWNTICWNPFGRFLMLGGFGNLPGDVETFEVSEEGKCTLLGSCRQNCVVTTEWSPCGRHLLLATTSPRLRVDNNFKVLSYRGELEFEQTCDTLFDAAWRPAPPGAFPDRAPSPPKKGTVGGGVAQGAPRPTSAKPAAYRPPHKQQGIPGAQPPGDGAPAVGEESAAAKKNRKKREAAARKKAEGV